MAPQMTSGAVGLTMLALLAAASAPAPAPVPVVFTEVTVDASGPKDPWTKIAGDLDGDGRPDVALAPCELARQQHKIAWFETPADPRQGPWRQHIVAEPVEAVVHSLAAADVNLDGQADIVFAEMHQGADPDEVGFFLNAGRGAAWHKQVVSRKGSHGLQAVDFDADGEIDLFGANWSGPFQPVQLWVNGARTPIATPLGSAARAPRLVPFLLHCAQEPDLCHVPRATGLAGLCPSPGLAPLGGGR